jgi:REP element-mobilizing transposase RayT
LNQRERYKHLVSKADKIAIIGLRFRPHDTHIWEPIKQTAAKIIYCAGENSGKEFTSLIKENRMDNHTLVLNGYFKDHFDEISRELGL